MVFPVKRARVYVHYTIQVGGCCCSWNKFPLDGREFAQWDWKSSRSSRAAIEKDKKLWVAFAWRYYISVSPLRNLQQTSGTAVGRAFKLITIVARSEWLEQLFSLRIERTDRKSGCERSLRDRFNQSRSI